ncbi:Uncharacterised protein [Mycobacterium tuberculosis]|uniref:Uncharacterized protein n=1 Tax=Mycobacterium tuberculosis TaxID=1773 RepID=A0A0U0SKD0_MYCTX|nr:Uncharacterised protein [Mycobacterium tuberculosis]COW86815.1 Uncharacterised protein [Mycobacterium tuberculosis]COW88580.1 Uncharacterised protein [Mycobacterium tuberculosis]COX26113.1 Uncharacterised protein [Mycobacterium tuberculosis]
MYGSRISVPSGARSASSTTMPRSVWQSCSRTITSWDTSTRRRVR